MAAPRCGWSSSSYPVAVGRKSRAKRERRKLDREEALRGRSRSNDRPHPLQAIEQKHVRLAERLAGRGDRFSELLSRLIQDEHAGQHLVTRSALSSEEYEELDRLRPGAHEALRRELDEGYSRLRDLVGAGDPFHIVAMVQFANVFSAWGSYYEPTHEGSETKVELLCGLLATQTPSHIGERPTPAAMQAIFDELDHIQDVVLLLNLSMPASDDPEAAGLRFSGAMRWMSIRGTSFDIHGRELAQEIYRPHDEWLVATFGFAIDDVIAVGDAVADLMSSRLNDLHRDGAEAMSRLADQRGKPEMAATVLAALELFETRIRGAMAFSEADLMAFKGGLDADRVRVVLDELSVEVGSLDPTAYTGLFDVNPLRERPFLKLGDEFVLGVPGMPTRDADVLLERRLLEGRSSFPRQRAKALDDIAVRHLVALLPGARAHTNLFYDEAELDGLVLFDDVAIVVEGKAGGMSVPARRGDVRRLLQDIKNNVEDAWRQGARARAYLVDNDESVFRDERGDVIVRVPPGSIRDVVIVNPTLHELAGHASQLGALRALGLFPEGELPWSVYINDLRVIAETSDNPAVFLHYLEWRSRLPLGEGVVVWDEIDLWGSYLFGERFGPLADGDNVVIANSSIDFDAYYEGIAGRGPKSKRPGKFLQEPVTNFVVRMAAERPPGWRSAAGACLDLSIPELAVAAVKTQELAEEAARDQAIVGFDAGRLVLLGIPSEADAHSVVAEYPVPHGDPTFVVACRINRSGAAEVAWAGYRKPVTFELSPLERAASELASPFASSAVAATE